jgi:hypothetical protein
MKELKIIMCLSVTETIYKRYPGIRLTDSQLAKLIVKEMGEGKEEKWLADIRRSRCNDSNQPYVDAKFVDGKWVKNK